MFHPDDVDLRIWFGVLAQLIMYLLRFVSYSSKLYINFQLLLLWCNYLQFLMVSQDVVPCLIRKVSFPLRLVWSCCTRTLRQRGVRPIYFDDMWCMLLTFLPRYDSFFRFVHPSADDKQ